MRQNKKNEYVEEVFAYLHTIPELGFYEYKTSKFIADELEKIGYKVIEKVGGTGVIGILDSGIEGPVFALRADMDALGYEKDGKEVYIHTCGHDAHSSMVLSAAKEIMENGIQRGKLYVVFQPAEEKLYGAKSVIESGFLNEVEEMVGIHLRPAQETSLGQATPALVHGASYKLVAKIKGLNAHGARPHLGVNAVDAAVLVVNAINAIRLDPRIPHSAKVTKLYAGGNTHNVIPDQAEIVMDLRAQTNEVMDEMISKIKDAITNSAKSIGAEGIVEFIGGVPGADYDEEMIEISREAIEEVLGEALKPMITPGGEDFHLYSKELNIKTAYIGLGADLTPGLHHPEMTFDQEALTIGVEILKKIVQKRLG